MGYWMRDDGTIFQSEEEAREDSYEYLDTDFPDYFFRYITIDKFLQWAMKQDQFWKDFEDIVSDAQEDMFSDWYAYHDEEVDKS